MSGTEKKGNAMSLIDRAKADAKEREKEKRSEARQRREEARAEVEALKERAAVVASDKLDTEITPADLRLPTMPDESLVSRLRIIGERPYDYGKKVYADALLEAANHIEELEAEVERVRCHEAEEHNLSACDFCLQEKDDCKAFTDGEDSYVYCEECVDLARRQEAKKAYISEVIALLRKKLLAKRTAALEEIRDLVRSAPKTHTPDGEVCDQIESLVLDALPPKPKCKACRGTGAKDGGKTFPVVACPECADPEAAVQAALATPEEEK